MAALGTGCRAGCSRPSSRPARPWRSSGRRWRTARQPVSGVRSSRSAAGACPVRWCAPSRWILATASTTRSRLREAVTERDHKSAARPPRRGCRRLPRRPACMTYAVATSAVVDPRDGVPGARGAGSSCARPGPRSPRADRTTAGPRRCPGPRSPRHGAGRREACRGQASTTWVSGSPKRALNSMTRRPARGGRQADEEHPHEGRSPTTHLVDRGLRDPRDDLVDEGRGRPVQRRVGTHATGVSDPRRCRRRA